jgi:protein-S-isoprenylcysteine O-methyltransferase Ste14
MKTSIWKPLLIPHHKKRSGKKGWDQQLAAFIAPFLMCVVLPFVIVVIEHAVIAHPVVMSVPVLAALGAVIGCAGLVLFFATVRTLLRSGRGTIMPWDPTRKLVVAGVYRRVRNPMILSLIVILSGEAVVFCSPGIGVLAFLNFAVNTVYFKYSEEPGLEKRFGAEYIEYMKNVRRWLPRLRPWRPRPGGTGKGRGSRSRK